MSVRGLLQSDAAVLVSDGETVDYRPKAGGGPYTINARIDRRIADRRPESPRVAALGATVTVLQSADTSVGVEIPLKGDHMDVVLEEGKAAVRARVKRVLASPPGLWMLEVIA